MIEWVAAGLAGALMALVAGYALWGTALARARSELAGAAARADALTGVAGTLDTVRSERDGLAAKLAGVEAGAAERERAFGEQKAGLLATGEALKAEFARLAGAALTDSQKQFLTVAEETLKRQRAEADKEMTANKEAMAGLLAPVTETLKRYEEGLTGFEQRRAEAYGSIGEQLAAVAAGQHRVGEEAAKLVSALRSSSKASGRWGEQQLKNVLEMGGLREGIDFTLQSSVATEEGARRPDAIIRLPGGRELIVDVKCSLEDYLAAGECDEAGRREALKRHALAVRAHIRALGDKAYWKEFGQSADFVVMFLAGENFLSAALESDLKLLDEAFERRILLTGPTNLLAIAKIVALVWRQDTLATEAREIGKLGAELYAGIAVMAEHVECVGEHLAKALGAHNKMIGSLETNVLPKARRLPELGVEKGKKPVPDLAPIEAERRLAVAPELRLIQAAE